MSESLKESIDDYMDVYSTANDLYRNRFSSRRGVIAESHQFALKVMELESLKEISGDMQYSLGMSFGR